MELEVFLKFNKILQLTNDVRDLTKALKKSEMLKLTEDKSKVFRVTPVKEKTNADECTIYVEHLSCDADHDWLKDIFSRFGKARLCCVLHLYLKKNCLILLCCPFLISMILYFFLTKLHLLKNQIFFM